MHDHKEYDTPQVWTEKQITDSSLLHDFPTIWQGLKATYQTELTPLAFIEIPDEKEIENSFLKLMERLQQ